MPTKTSYTAKRGHMAFYEPECVKREGKDVVCGVVSQGEGTRWQKMPEKGTVVHPPPVDLHCEACGLGPEQVPPFGGPGDPLHHDYSAALLVKRDREVGLLGARWECRSCILLTDEELERRARKRA